MAVVTILLNLSVEVLLNFLGLLGRRRGRRVGKQALTIPVGISMVDHIATVTSPSGSVLA